MSGIPVLDVDVQAALVKMNQPRLFFGEGPMARRLRLLGLLADDPTLLNQDEAVEAQATPQVAQRDHSVYPIAQDAAALVALRWQILEHSMRASAARQAGATAAPPSVRRQPLSRGGRSIVTMVSSEAVSTRPLSCVASDGAGALWAGDVGGNIVAIREGQRVHGTADDKPTYEASSRVLALLPLASHDCVASAHMTPSIQLHRPGGAKAQNLAGHSDRVNRLDALHLASGVPVLFSTSHDTTWRMWDVARGESVLRQPGHGTAVYGLAVHPDGGVVATGDAAGLTFLWDTRIGRRVAVIRTMTTEVLCLAFSPDGQYLAAAGGDNVGRIYDMRASFSECQMLLGHTSLISQVAWRSNGSLVTSSFDKTVAVWHAGSSVAHATCAASATGHDGKVMGIVASPTEPSEIASIGFDKTVKLWSVE